MKRVSIKRILVVAMATCMIMGSTLSVSADSNSNSNSNSNSSTITTPSTSASTVSSVASAPSSSSVMLAGQKVSSTIAGVYMAKSIPGCVVTTPIAEVKALLGLTAGQTPFLVINDTDVKKSHLAMDSLTFAASALNATMGPVININLGFKEAGKFKELSEGKTVDFTVALPAQFMDATSTYAVIGVRKGGAITVYEDKDINPNTVTFELGGGLGCYAIVKY